MLIGVLGCTPSTPNKLGTSTPNTLIKWVQVLCLDLIMGADVPQYSKYLDPVITLESNKRC